MKILPEASKLKSPANGNARAMCIALIMVKRRKWEGERTRGTRKTGGKGRNEKAEAPDTQTPFVSRGKNLHLTNEPQRFYDKA